MIEKKRREKLMDLINQAETLMAEIDTDNEAFLSAVLICRTVCGDAAEAVKISAESDEMLMEKLRRIRSMYDTGK